MKINIVTNGKENSVFVYNALVDLLINSGFIITDTDYDVTISIGGDGTFLYNLRNNNFNTEIGYIGINTGSLGFLQNIKANELKKLVNALENNEFYYEKVNYLDITVKTSDETYAFKAINELVVREQGLKTITLTAYVDGNEFERVVGDGVLISSKTGSTAYNMSLGGPVIYNNPSVLILTPISPLINQKFNTIKNSFVFNDNCISLKPTGKTNNLLIIIDGIVKNVNNVEYIEIKNSLKPVKFIRLHDYDYTEVIKDKLVN